MSKTTEMPLPDGGKIVTTLHVYDDCDWDTSVCVYDDRDNKIKEIYTDSEGWSYTTEWEYDDRNNLIKEHYTDSNGHSYTTEWEYDADNNKTKEHYTYNNGWSYTTEYDADGKVKENER